MYAIVAREFGPPEVLRYEELPDPTPGAGEVLVRVRAVGVNPVETYKREGKYAVLPTLPYIPGSDAAGEVAAVGPGVTRWQEGDRVYTDHLATSAYAGLLVVAEERLQRLPLGVDFAQGTTLGIGYATAYRALFQRGGARAGERVLIRGGTGGVGMAAIQLARAAGLEIVATGGSEEGRREMLRQGAHVVLAHDDGGLAEAAGSAGFDLILEMLADRNLAHDLELVARRGRVIVVGNRGTVEINPRMTMARDADIRGFSLYNATPSDLTEIHAALAAGVEVGALRPVVGERFPLSEAAAAQRRVLTPGHIGKIVLEP